MAVRRELHARGLRFRVHVKPVVGLRRTADIAFTRHRLAIMIDGCFWHGCPEHATRPKTNATWWATKIATNRERDAETDRRLVEAGWTVIRIWEHEEPVSAADRVSAWLAMR